MIRVALLDDHPAVLVGLTSLLKHTPEIGVIAAAPDGATLARALGTQRPDVLVIDYDPARGDALALCRRIKARPGPMGVLIYSAYASERLAIAARVAQADGVLDKGVPVDTLIEAIRQIAHGQPVFPDLTGDALATTIPDLDAAHLPVFRMLLKGEPVHAIADTLCTSEDDIAKRSDRLVAQLRPRLGPHEASFS